jgi:uncharacterized protein
MNAKKRKRIIIWTIIAAAISLLLTYSSIEAQWLQVDREVFTSKELPADFSGVKVAFIADSHLGPFLSPRQLRRVVDMVNAEFPDIVILGGDYVRRDPADVPVAFQELTRLQATIGKYAILGNHDYWAGRDNVIAQIEKAGFTPLINESKPIYFRSSRIFIAGLDDYDEGFPDLHTTMTDIHKADFAILVLHNPIFLREDGKKQAALFKNIDLALAGHTHGGQATIFGLWSPGEPDQLLPMYTSKWRIRGGVMSLVSNGVGTSFLPLRFFALPEINVITLKK